MLVDKLQSQPVLARMTADQLAGSPDPTYARAYHQVYCNIYLPHGQLGTRAGLTRECHTVC